MPAYICRVGHPDGTVTQKEIQAANQQEAERNLRDAGLHVFNIRQQTGFQLRKRQVPAKHFVVFNQELLALIKAGIPIFNGLKLLEKRIRHDKFRAYIGEVVNLVKEGQPLSQAFLSMGDRFPAFYPSVLLAGERSGNLEDVLESYIRHERLLLSTRKRLRSAFIYPAFLVLVAMVSIGIIINYVLPSFADFYKGFDKELPVITQWVVAVSGAMRKYIWLELGAILGIVLGIRWMLRTDGGRKLLERVLIRVPLLREVWRRYVLSQFCRTLSILLDGGLPVMDSLNTMAVTNPSLLFAADIRTASTRVSQGGNLSGAFSDSMMDDLTLDMIRIGEEAGSVPDMLKSAAEYQDEDLNNLLSGVVSLVAPAVLFLMGGVIAMLLIAMYLPLFEVTDIMS